MPHQQQLNPETRARNAQFNELYATLTDEKGVLYPFFHIANRLRICALSLENEVSLDATKDLPIVAMELDDLRETLDSQVEAVAVYIFGAGEGLPK